MLEFLLQTHANEIDDIKGPHAGAVQTSVDFTTWTAKNINNTTKVTGVYDGTLFGGVSVTEDTVISPDGDGIVSTTNYTDLYCHRGASTISGSNSKMVFVGKQCFNSTRLPVNELPEENAQAGIFFWGDNNLLRSINIVCSTDTLYLTEVSTRSKVTTTAFPLNNRLNAGGWFYIRAEVKDRNIDIFVDGEYVGNYIPVYSGTGGSSDKRFGTCYRQKTSDKTKYQSSKFNYVIKYEYVEYNDVVE